MQRLDLRNNLAIIINSLNSREILKIFDTSSEIGKGDLIRLMIDSKRGYDSNVINEEMKQIFEQFNTKPIYETDYFSQMINFIPTAANQKKNTYLIFDPITRFYNFHKSLISTFNLIDNLLLTDRTLFDSNNDYDYKSALEKGNLTLQIIDNEYVKLQKIINILESCQKLIETVYSYSLEVNKEKIDEIALATFIDSGTDININIKLPKKAAMIIAELLKEFWDFFLINKFYRLKKKNAAIEDTLSLVKKINQALEEKNIDLETAERLKLGIISNTENIVFNNTLPKELLLESKTISNRDVLLNRTQILLLEKSSEDIKE